MRTKPVAPKFAARGRAPDMPRRQTAHQFRRAPRQNPRAKICRAVEKRNPKRYELIFQFSLAEMGFPHAYAARTEQRGSSPPSAATAPPCSRDRECRRAAARRRCRRARTARRVANAAKPAALENVRDTTRFGRRRIHGSTVTPQTRSRLHPPAPASAVAASRMRRSAARLQQRAGGIIRIGEEEDIATRARQARNIQQAFQRKSHLLS